jgi:ethanolamine ammonia-lyase small subunit
MDRQDVEKIVREVMKRVLAEQSVSGVVSAETHPTVTAISDITEEEMPKWDFVHGVKAREFAALKSRTPARLAVGHCGTRYPTHTRLRFLADHAAAKDAVDSEIPEDFIRQYSLPALQSLCASREEYITRPDLGRQLSQAGIDALRSLSSTHADVCIFLADGLSAKAIVQNGMDTLLTAKAGLEAAGLRVAPAFAVRYGRVGVMDVVTETLQCPVTCVLIGERPGLGVADSMSAYAAYGATVGMSESRRTVISNIHGKGTPAIEAGAWLAELLRDMHTTKLSGMELREAQNSGTSK